MLNFFKWETGDEIHFFCRNKQTETTREVESFDREN